MDELHEWLKKQFDDRLVEPNSELGKAISYMLKHWKKLTLFLRQAGAPLDNNLCERVLKRAILHRKNSLFFKTQQRRTRRRSLHEPYPHLRIVRHQSVRLSGRAADQRRTHCRATWRLDALELSPNPRSCQASRLNAPRGKRSPPLPAERCAAGVPPGDYASPKPTSCRAVSAGASSPIPSGEPSTRLSGLAERTPICI